MAPLAPVLCVFGTASDVGKSWLTTGIARIFQRAGIDVAPYKAQNMSNNAGVTPEGGEMGRAQIVQAEACALPPHVDMNPLLLKPNTDTGSQVVLLGRVVGNQEASEWFRGGMEPRRQVVLDALDRLRARHGLIVAEGAGSCAEVNLRHRDLVNMPVAHHAESPVILVGDIARGGIFAQLVGTLEVMPPEDRARVKGLVINRFRGDISLFEDGRRWIEERTGVPVLGVIPWLWAARIESEDGLQADVQLDAPAPDAAARAAAPQIAVLRIPHISNFTDLEALQRHGVAVHYLATPRDLSAYDLVVLPGSKNTRGDLAWLEAQGWVPRLHAHRAAGGRLLGLCGGYQMLGRSIEDPTGIEGEPGRSPGLGMLPVDTVMGTEKRTVQIRGQLRGPGGTWDPAPVTGYEIHVGRTTVDHPQTAGPMALLTDEQGVHPDGAWSSDGRVGGTYLHGLFDEPAAVHALMSWCRPDQPTFRSEATESAWDFNQRQYDLLAEHLEQHLDLERLFGLVGLPR